MNDTLSDMELVSVICLHVRALTCESAASNPRKRQIRFVTSNAGDELHL